MLAQFGEILTQPSFTNAEIDRYRKNALGGLQKMADHPEEFTEYLMANYLYGTHPYGHESVGTPKTVKGIKRSDLQSFYAANYDPKNSIMAVVGQYDKDWKEEVVKTLESWKSKSPASLDVPEFPSWKGRELLLVDRGDLNQAQIAIGFKGITRNIPEYMELRAALKILRRVVRQPVVRRDSREARTHLPYLRVVRSARELIRPRIVAMTTRLPRSASRLPRTKNLGEEL